VLVLWRIQAQWCRVFGQLIFGVGHLFGNRGGKTRKNRLKSNEVVVLNLSGDNPKRVNGSFKEFITRFLKRCGNHPARISKKGDIVPDFA